VAQTSPRESPSTTPRAKADRAPVVAAAGDIACRAKSKPGANCQHKAVSDAILADTDVTTVLSLGDNQYEKGSLNDYQSSYDQTWGRFKNKTRPVPGNHDYKTPGAAGYYDYFGSAAGDRNKGYYSFDVGAWHFVALNSEVDLKRGGRQLAWLKADLKSHPNQCVAAYWHQPRWSSGTEHGDYVPVAPFFEALYAANADLILNGHEHSYERFHPLNPAGVRDDKRGIVEIVSGLGGRNHYPVRGRATTAAKDNTSYGYSRLTLHPKSATIEFQSAVGSYRDSYQLTCH
jgi:3',5'-cyclic AMP phosphodiesterase CpdA